MLANFLFKTLAVLLICLMPGPAVWVQQTAWISMLVSYSQDKGIKRAVVETFDGQHPCELCKVAERILEESEDGDGNEPLAPHESRTCIAWGATILSEAKVRIKAPVASDIPPHCTPWLSRCIGSGAAAPEPPPPKWTA